MIDFSEIGLFEVDGKMVTYQDLLRDIYSNSDDTRESMRTLIDQMVGLVDSPSSAVAMMDHINKLLDSKIKNDDLLVKVAAILSRVLAKSTSDRGGDDLSISEEEKRQLLLEVDRVRGDVTDAEIDNSATNGEAVILEG